MIFSSLRLIISESFKWRNRQILETNEFAEAKLTYSVFLKKNILGLLISLIISLYFNGLINKDFSANMVTALSVFVGLFTTTLILIFDKYISHYKINDPENTTTEVDLARIPSDLETNLLRTKNFSKKFVFISLESLLIAIICIILLIIPMMIGDDFTIDIRSYQFVSKNIAFSNISLFLKNTFILFIRASIFILLSKYFKYMFFIFGALGEYIKGVFDENITDK